MRRPSSTIDGVADADLEGRGLAAQALRHQLQGHLVLADEEGVGLEERRQDLRLVHAERTQDDRHRQLAAAVDAREHAVLGVELEVQPGAAVGNDAGREQQLPGGMGLAAVVVEEHARGTVQLRDDDALGAVDHEGAVVGHERQLAEVDLLLAHVLDRLLGAGGLLVQHDQAHLDAQRGGIGQPAQLALLDVEHRLAEPVAHVLEGSVAAVARDREDALEGSVQADRVAVVLRLVDLEELAIRVELDGQQVRRVENARLLAKVLADALLLGKGISHRVHLRFGRCPTGRGHQKKGRTQSSDHHGHQIAPSSPWARCRTHGDRGQHEAGLT